MSLASWFRHALLGQPANNENYHRARALIGEATASAQDLNRTLKRMSYDPFRAIVRDLQTQKAVSEYDQCQAAEIYEKQIPR